MFKKVIYMIYMAVLKNFFLDQKVRVPTQKTLYRPQLFFLIITPQFISNRNHQSMGSYRNKKKSLGQFLWKLHYFFNKIHFKSLINCIFYLIYYHFQKIKYRGVTHQSDTFGFKLKHIRVKHLMSGRYTLDRNIWS